MYKSLIKIHSLTLETVFFSFGYKIFSSFTFEFIIKYVKNLIEEKCHPFFSLSLFLLASSLLFK
jgi:hypothetical protein